MRVLYQTAIQEFYDNPLTNTDVVQIGWSGNSKQFAKENLRASKSALVNTNEIFGYMIHEK